MTNYVKDGKQHKINMVNNIWQQLHDIAYSRGISINLLVNQILNNYLINYQTKYSGNHQMSPPNIVWKHKGVTLLQNDVTSVDLSKWKGKVNLIVTSPPYNIGIAYNNYDDNLPDNEYQLFTYAWLRQMYDVMADDGRMCVNIPLYQHSKGNNFLYNFLQVTKDVGLREKTTIIWNKGLTKSSQGTGTWMSAKHPSIIAPIELIVVLYKKQFKRQKNGITTVTEREFYNWIYGIWRINGQHKRLVGNHPAPYPVDIPRRCIGLYSYKNDLIMDPFAGSGTTMVASVKEGRKSIGIEIDQQYVTYIIDRLTRMKQNVKVK